jgi:hypothetical protein
MEESMAYSGVSSSRKLVSVRFPLVSQSNSRLAGTGDVGTQRKVFRLSQAILPLPSSTLGTERL